MRNFWNDSIRRTTALVTLLVLAFAISVVALAEGPSKSTSGQVFVLALEGKEQAEPGAIPEETTVPVTQVDPPSSSSTTTATVRDHDDY